MKLLTTIVAATALIAGASVASAQNSTNTDQNAPPASINKGSLPKPESGAQKASPSGMTRSTTGSAAGINHSQEVKKRNANPGTQTPANGAEKEK